MATPPQLPVALNLPLSTCFVLSAPQVLVALDLPLPNCFLLPRCPVSLQIRAQRCTLTVSVMRSCKCQFSAEFRKERTVDLPVESPGSFRCYPSLGALFCDDDRGESESFAHLSFTIICLPCNCLMLSWVVAIAKLCPTVGGSTSSLHGCVLLS
jgi:hypothetical protein